MTNILDIRKINQENGHISEFSCFGGDYAFARITTGSQNTSDISMVNRFDGLTMFLCVSGNYSMQINTSVYDITENTLIVAGANDIFRPAVSGPVSSDVNVYSLFLSMDFIKDVNIDINILGFRQPQSNRKPIIKLTDDESRLLQRYFELLHLNTVKNTDAIYVKGISRNIIASVIYQLLQFLSNDRDKVEEAPDRTHSRRSHYVSDFMRLVHKYYRSERSVGFYAGKLFISPKYLSLIIKESTGRSAAEWIDEFVILEAKNLLRFSGQNVQQIAYELNFSNQSSFGKYFKHLTGMSPTEFQRS